MPSPG
jgi:REP element-mobilizing transposase RayT